MPEHSEEYEVSYSIVSSAALFGSKIVYKCIVQVSTRILQTLSWLQGSLPYVQEDFLHSHLR